MLINNSYSAWQESPIATTITTHPLATLQFPNVTVCPPKDSNTALYPDLMRADNSSLTEDDRESLRSSIQELLTISALEFADNMLAAANPANLEATYRGYQSVPKPDGPNGFEVKVSGIEGSIKSSRFGEAYSEDHYKTDRTAHVVLDLSDVVKEIGSGTLIIELEVDTRQGEEGWREEVEYKEGSRFKLFGDEEGFAKSWIDADAHCKTRGGQLASLLSETEKNEFESLEIKTKYYSSGGYKKKYTNAWVGARQDEKNGDWLWTNGMKLNKEWRYEPAASWDKPPFCMMVSTSMKWYQKVCNATKKYPFVCKFSPLAVNGTKKIKLVYTEKELVEDRLSNIEGFSAFHVWYKYQAVGQELLDSWDKKRMTGFKLSWRIETELGKVPEPLSLPSPSLKSQMLEKLVGLTLQARLEGLHDNVLIARAFEEKEILTGNNTVRKCSRGQMSYKRTDLDKFTLGLNKTNTTIEHVATNEDIKNGLLYYAMFRFCPKGGSKIGQFLELLVSTASPRTILLSLVNSLESNMLTRTERVFLGKFYEALNKIMDLSFGKILLALSSPTQLESMLAQDMPFIEPYSKEIEECLQEYKCGKLVELIETLGNIYPRLVLM